MNERSSTHRSFSLEAEREATPGCAAGAHLNAAGAALQRTETIQAVVDHLVLESEIGGYEAELQAADRLVAVRSSAARLLGTSADEVAIAGSDTQAWTKAIWGFALGGNLRPGQRIVTDQSSYDSHFLGLLQIAEVTGCAVEYVRNGSDGVIELDALTSSLQRGDVGLFAGTWIGTHRGILQPAAAMGARCATEGVPFFLDACQAAGQLPIDVENLGCAVLTTTGRKWLRGPRGTALLYVRRSLHDRMTPPGRDGNSSSWTDAGHFDFAPGIERFSEFESSKAAVLGFGVAIEHALAVGLDVIAEQVSRVAGHLRTALADVDGVTVRDGAGPHCGIVTFSLASATPTEVRAAAADAGISVWSTHAAQAKLDMPTSGPDELVRASPHYFTTIEECDRLVEVVAALT